MGLVYSHNKAIKPVKQKLIMNANTLKAVTKHGQSLLAAFPNCTEKDPVALCKKLRRIETATHRVMLDYCNGTATPDEADKAGDRAISRLQVLLYGKHDNSHKRIVINMDPRGYALKLDSEWVKFYNERQYTFGKTAQPIHTDMGGFGILAPDLNQ